MSLTELSLAGYNLPSPSPRKVWPKQIQESRKKNLQCVEISFAVTCFVFNIVVGFLNIVVDIYNIEGGFFKNNVHGILLVV